MQGHVRPVAKALSRSLSKIRRRITPHSKEMSALPESAVSLPKSSSYPLHYHPKAGGVSKFRQFELLLVKPLFPRAHMTLLSSQCAAIIQSGRVESSRSITVPGMHASEIVAVEVLSNQCTPTQAPMTLCLRHKRNARSCPLDFEILPLFYTLTCFSVQKCK